MRTLFDSARISKATTFGHGLLRSLPSLYSAASQADRDWWTAETLGGASARVYDVQPRVSQNAVPARRSNAKL